MSKKGKRITDDQYEALFALMDEIAPEKLTKAIIQREGWKLTKALDDRKQLVEFLHFLITLYWEYTKGIAKRDERLVLQHVLMGDKADRILRLVELTKDTLTSNSSSVARDFVSDFENQKWTFNSEEAKKAAEKAAAERDKPKRKRGRPRKDASKAEHK